MRERWGRSRAFICSEADAARLVPGVVALGSTIVTEFFPGYNRLRSRYRVLRVNHQKQFSDGDASTNWAESYFARLDRSEKGIHHRITGNYLDQYANEMSWREDNRRVSNGEQYLAAVGAALEHPVSRQWKGYWQRAA